MANKETLAEIFIALGSKFPFYVCDGADEKPVSFDGFAPGYQTNDLNTAIFESDGYYKNAPLRVYGWTERFRRSTYTKEKPKILELCGK